MSDAPEVLFEKRGVAGIITLNRPKALNALTLGMVRLIHPQLDAWVSDDSVKIVIVEGAGEKAFCAGGDIRAMYDAGRAGDPGLMDFYREEYRLNAAIKHYSKPYVALMDGITMGGGVGLSVHGKWRIATERFLFAMPETGIGFFPDVGGTYFLPRCPGEIGMYLALTGERLKAADAVFAGIVDTMIPSQNLEDLKRRLCQGERIEMVLDSLSTNPGPAPLAGHREIIEDIFVKASVADILASLETHGGGFAAKTLATLQSRSPTSLLVTYRQIREGMTLSFRDAMQLEFRLTHRFMAGHDFYEGVRAVLIDKDQAPKWQPARLSDVGAADIDAYFAPLATGELQFD